MESRIIKYIDKMPPAVSGQRGHDRTFAVACKLVLGFDLSPNEAIPYMRHYNKVCEPAWTEKELAHKVADANRKPGERGYLRNRARGHTRRRRKPRSLPDARKFHF